MSTESYSNDETLLFFILIMVLQFAMIFFFQMSFVYTGFPKSWHVFYWCWAEPEKACASKCSQHLQGLGNPQAISGLITILILGESLCLSFLIIRISRHTSPLWLWSHLLCCRSVCVEAAPDQQPCRAQHRLGKLPQIHRQHSQQVLECCGHSVLHFLLGCSKHLAHLHAVVTGQHLQSVLRGGKCQHSLSPGLPSGADSQFPYTVAVKDCSLINLWRWDE